MYGLAALVQYAADGVQVWTELQLTILSCSKLVSEVGPQRCLPSRRLFAILVYRIGTLVLPPEQLEVVHIVASTVAPRNPEGRVVFPV